MPHKKLRQIYAAMVQARLVWKALPPAKRAAAPTFGMEACLASTSVDLGPQDLVSDALAGGAVDFLRGAKLGSVLRAAAKKPGRVVADCGTASRLPATGGAAERLWGMLGAAAALKTLAAAARASGSDAPKGVVVAYLLPGEAKAALLRQVFACAAKQELPLVFVAMPPAAGARAGGMSELALESGVPGIAVDGDDAVAIYRVAQESIGRARMGGGAALIECVPFAVAGSTPAEDAIAALERYVLQRGVCTRAWMDRAAGVFAERVKAAKAYR